jgi:hypothetical protein
MSIVYLWIALSLLGAGLYAGNLREALIDRRLARTQEGYDARGTIALMARASVRRMVVGLVVMLTFLAVGVSVLLAPGQSLARWALTGGLIAANIILVLDAIARWRVRGPLRRAALRERAADEAFRALVRRRRRDDDAG